MTETTDMIIKESGGQLTSAAAMLNAEQKAILKAVICKDATDQELNFFAQVCAAKQMDPFSGEIYMIKRKGKPTIQTGIDGFRAQAERSGYYAGSDKPVFIFDDNGRPTQASVTVYKMVMGARIPFTAEIWWDEFYPGDGEPGFMWRAKPKLMLGKCAEAQALRKAFPRQLAGMHIPEEMDSAVAAEISQQSNSKVAAVTESLKLEKQEDTIASRAQRALAAFANMGQTEVAVLARLGVKSVSEINLSHLNGPLAAWYDELRNAEPIDVT